MNPRHFPKSAAAGTIALNVFPHHLFASETKKYATDRVKLGMRGLADLFIAGYDNGLMLWDSADQYGTHSTSCHTLGALKAAASSPWVEVDLGRFNAAQVLMDSTPNEVYSVLGQMKASGKGVIGMKILGAGKLRDKPDECLQFILAHNHIDCFTAASVRG